MADIAICLDNDCPSKATCKRSMFSGTVPNEYWQSYHEFNRPANLIKCNDYEEKK